MSVILAYTSPARGHLFPATAILLELQRRGHRTAVLTLASEIERMKGLGFVAEPIDPRLERIEHPVDGPKGTVAALKASVAVFAARAAIDADDLQQAIDRHRPDALLVDANSWGAVAVAERWAADTGRPWADLFPYPPPVPSRDVPPFGPGVAPARGALGRARDRLLRPVIVGTIERTMLPIVNEVRRRVGVPEVANATEMLTTAPLMLVTTAEPFEYPKSDWPASAALVGPCEWEPPLDPPAWLDDVRDPIVLVTTSSEAQDDERLVRIALEGLADEPVHVVATMPAGVRGTLDVPSNAHVEDFAPHGAILDRAAVAVTHGGMGATQKALGRGVPVCVVPFGRDQMEVAQRVRQSGAGVSLSARRLTPARLRDAVREARTCAAGARRIADAFAAAGGPVAAADAIERSLPVDTPVA